MCPSIYAIKFQLVAPTLAMLTYQSIDVKTLTYYHSSLNLYGKLQLLTGLSINHYN